MDILNNRSIRTSLFLAFGLLCFFSILSSTIGIYSNSQLRTEYQLAIEKNIPSMASMVQVSTEAVLLTKLVPQLYSAETDEARRKYWRRLQDTIDLVTLRLQNMLSEKPDDEELKITLDKLSILRTLLININKNVKDRIASELEIRSSYKRIILISEEFFENINQLKKVARPSLADGIPTYSLWSTDVVLKLELTGYRLVHTLESIYAGHDSSNLHILDSHLGAIISDLDKYVLELDSFPSLTNVKNALASLREAAAVERNVFNKLRTIKKANINNSKTIFQESEIVLESVNYNIGEYVSRIQIDSILTSQKAISKVKTQHSMVISIGMVSIFFSILVMWLYVKRRIVNRIDTLNKSMRIISTGDLKYHVPVSGADEIGAMAKSLVSFRDQLHEKQFELIQASKLAAIGQLSAGISHEINQPLTAIGHYAHNGSRMLDYKKYDEAQINFKNITRLIKKATAITSRLKSIARKPQENLYKVNILKSVNNVLEILSSYPGFKLVNIKVDIQQNNDVLAEQVQLEQVILNIVKNSIDALETKNGLKAVEIKSRRKEKYIYIDIKDNGSGIPEELEGKIFDPFFTTKNSEKGLGLGLAISYSIIKSFGGDIKTRPNVDQGSVFSIKLVAIN